ncbi:MAG: HEPN domain-containing protein [Candidatus Lokiarchaeota archaeon]|nr:HEPN domain-containing protein [Candidatus Lokiarchaeota archaeon]
MRRPSEEEATRWFIQAKDEFQDANTLRKMERYYLALFHFQQAAEKALKAFLYLHVKSIKVFYTHSIAELLESVIKFDKDFEKVQKSKKLDQYYISTRYPNGLPGGIPSKFYDDPEEALDASLLAEKVIKLVESKIT